MFRKLHKFNQLDRAEKRLLLNVWLCLWWVRIMLWIRDFNRTHSRLRKKALTDQHATKDLQYAEKVASFISSASRFVPKASCLSQALVGEYLLSLGGLKPDLHIGVSKEPNKTFEGHAWIVLNGRKLIGGPASIRFTSIYQTHSVEKAP